MTSSSGIYKLILNKFPHKHIRFAFAYGSAVFKQLENDASATNSMIDFVFVVDDSIRFHDENLKLNSSHYSFVKHSGPYYLARIQNDVSAACFYNTLVTLKLDADAAGALQAPSTVLMKYGVISEEALIRDLYDWDYLYVSGRLQKPVKIIKRPMIASAASTAAAPGSELSYGLDTVNKSIDLALQTNLKNALHASLLLMPEKFTLTELITTIASLSYTGDFRMVVGENKNKITNIVLPQMGKFLELYKPYIIKECFEEYLDCNFETEQCLQNSTHNTIYHHINNLPKNLLHTMIATKFKTSHFYDLEEYIAKMATMLDYQRCVRASVGSIVKRASTIQSAKGVLTAGLFKTVNYSWRKLKKMFN